MEENNKVESYEIALSYAHADLKIAEIIREELVNIFADGFFMDRHKPDELASADAFVQKLQDIFKNANYAVILYSKGYNDGKFTGAERDAIIRKAEEKNDYSHIFIININDYDVYEKLSQCTYISLKVPEDEEGRSLKMQIHDIIHKRIKKRIIKKTIDERKIPTEYSFNIQTLQTSGNPFRWETDYDWNLLGTRYIGKYGKKIKEDTKWEYFWSYIENEFTLIKDNLKRHPDIVFKLRFNCHLSIAYKLGKIYGDLWQASGNRNLILVSSGKVKGTIFTFSKEINCKVPDDFCIEYNGNNLENPDIVCIISIKPYEQGNILETVKQFLKNSKTECSKIYLFKQEICIKDADTLEGMGKYLREKMRKCRTGSECKIHLFADTTAPLMFVLAAKTIFPGKVRLYEYIDKEDSYEFSLEV